MSTQQKIIQWQLNTSFAIGVPDQISGSPLVLSKISGGRNAIWDVDLAKNVILLTASGGTLAVDFTNGQAGNQVPLVLSPYNGTPTQTQQWSFLIKGGYITSLANTSLVIDVKSRVATDGQPIWGYTFNGSPAQQWKAYDPFAALALIENEAAEPA